MKNIFLLRVLSITAAITLSLHTPSFASSIGQIAEFSMGAALSSYGHEWGHASAAFLHGADVESVRINKTAFKLSEGLSEPEKKAQLRTIALAGFFADILATELIVQNQAWHSSRFALGWMSAGIYTSLVNPFRFYILGKKKNDLAVYEKYGGDPLLPSLIMAAYAVWTIDRIQKSTQIPSELGEELFIFPVIFAVEL